MLSDNRVYDGCTDTFNMINEGTHLYAVTSDDKEAQDGAIQFVRDKNYTPDDVKIVKVEGCIIVIAKRNIPGELDG